MRTIWFTGAARAAPFAAGQETFPRIAPGGKPATGINVAFIQRQSNAPSHLAKRRGVKGR